MHKNLFSLKGKTVIISGGTGHLGTEITKAFAHSGAKVYALGRNVDSLKFLNNYNSELSEQEGSIKALQVDVMNDSSFKLFFDKYLEENDIIDVFINNALASKREPVESLSTKSFKEGLDGSLTHCFSNIKTVSGKMLDQGFGSIINSASMFGFLSPNPEMYLDLGNQPSLHLSVGKAGVLQMTKVLASEWAKKGIRVNSISAGFFPKKRGPDRPDYIRQLTLRIPMGRIGMSKEVPGAYIFLASDASSYMTGQNLIVDGGYSIW